MEVWKSQSNYTNQVALSLGCALAGSVLLWGFRDYHSAGPNALAGFWLGALLLGLGGWSVVAGGRQGVTVDPQARCISVDDTGLFTRKHRSIPFGEVSRVSIGYLGKKSNGVNWYYLVLHLADGEEYPLFAPGRCYAGGTERLVVAGWRRRLEEYLGLSGEK